jgi:hypothetical protein
VGSLWKVAILTNMSCDGANFAFQISKVLTTTAIDIILQKGPQKSFKKINVRRVLCPRPSYFKPKKKGVGNSLQKILKQHEH